MLTKEQNDLLTQIGPGTPGGELLRRYWQPAALADQLPPGGPPLPIRLLGEDLVLFRDERERIGLLGLHCSHRRTDLSYGRIENGGLRCIYHGWLYDVHGRCLEQPAEPAGSTFHEQIRHLAYPCHEAAGVILTYMGPGEPPLLPAYDLFLAPEDHRYIPNKSFNECSYLQGNEGNIDPLHNHILHRLAQDVSSNRLRPWWELWDVKGTIDAEPTNYGLRISTAFPLDHDQIGLKISNFVMPNLCVIKGGSTGDGYQIDWHVPIDDTHHWKYTLAFDRVSPVDSAVRLRAESVREGYVRARNGSNRYLQNRAEMQTHGFAGMGTENLDHDACAIETEGAIEDRELEHLGYSDKALVMARLMLLRAIRDVQEGRDPLHVIRDPAANHFSHLFALRGQTLPATKDWRAHWREAALA